MTEIPPSQPDAMSELDGSTPSTSSRHTSRRRLLQGAAAAVGALTTASYVRPSMRVFTVPEAYAQVGSVVPQVTPTATATATPRNGQCGLDVKLTRTVTGTNGAYTISGVVTVTNVSTSCVVCSLTDVSIYLYLGTTGPNYQVDTSSGYEQSRDLNGGASTPLGCKTNGRGQSVEYPYSFSVSVSGDYSLIAEALAENASKNTYRFCDDATVRAR